VGGEKNIINRAFKLGLLIIIVASPHVSYARTPAIYLSFGKASIDGGEFKTLTNIARVFAETRMPVDIYHPYALGGRFYYPLKAYWGGGADVTLLYAHDEGNLRILGWSENVSITMLSWAFEPFLATEIPVIISGYPTPLLVSVGPALHWVQIKNRETSSGTGIGWQCGLAFQMQLGPVMIAPSLKYRRVSLILSDTSSKSTQFSNSGIGVMISVLVPINLLGSTKKAKTESFRGLKTEEIKKLWQQRPKWELTTDSTWRSSLKKQNGWYNTQFDDSAWKPAIPVAWGGKGIWYSKPTRPSPLNDICYFRKTFNVNERGRLLIYITADDLYRLYFNGRYIGGSVYEGQEGYYDLTSYMQVGGINLIAVKAINTVPSAKALKCVIRFYGNEPGEESKQQVSPHRGR